MAEDRFPYEDCPRCPNIQGDSDRWLNALESSGTENVRYRLAQINAGSAGAFSIGTVNALTIGFAQEWLAWHDCRKSDREAAFRANQIFWTRWAAIAASFAATAAVLGWLITIMLRQRT